MLAVCEYGGDLIVNLCRTRLVQLLLFSMIKPSHQDSVFLGAVLQASTNYATAVSYQAYEIKK